MNELGVLFLLLFVWVCFLAPLVGAQLDAHRQRRREVARLGRIECEPRRINQIRRDPSPAPRPRKRSAA